MIKHIKYFLIGFLLISISGCMSYQEKILDKSLRLHESREHVIETMMELATKPGQEKQNHLKEQVSEKSLSYFLLTTPLRIISEKFDFEASSYDFSTLHQSNLFLMQYGTLCRLVDLKSFKWNQKTNGFSGSFTFETEYGYKGRCLFEGKSDTITKMVIAKRNSNKMLDGYGVFGCEYGKNILYESNYDHAIILPLSNNGTVFTEKNKDDVNISLRRNGCITFANRLISIGQINEILTLHKAKTKNKGRIFLWIDKQCPEKYTKRVKEIVVNIEAPAYQVFYSLESKEKDRNILIGKKL